MLILQHQAGRSSARVSKISTLISTFFSDALGQSFVARLLSTDPVSVSAPLIRRRTVFWKGCVSGILTGQPADLTWAGLSVNAWHAGQQEIGPQCQGGFRAR